MTEATHSQFRQSDEYKIWANLHRRVVAGERLTETESQRYVKVLNWLDQDEVKNFAEAAAHTRAETERLESENRRLREKYDALNDQISLLEKSVNQAGVRQIGSVVEKV